MAHDDWITVCVCVRGRERERVRGREKEMKLIAVTKFDQNTASECM